jgi:hypothetical protein
MYMKYIEFFNFIFKGEITVENYNNSNYLIFINCMQGLIKSIFLVLFLKLLFVVLINTFSNLNLNENVVSQPRTIVKILFVCLLGPIIEELAFRLPLSTNKNYLLLSIPFITFLIFIYLKKKSSIDVSLIFSFLIIIVLFCMVIKLNFFKDNIFILTHILTLLFAIMHWNNTKNLTEVNYFFRFILFIIPMLISGYFLAFLRLKYGLWWSIVTHCIHNLIFTLPVIFKILWK